MIAADLENVLTILFDAGASRVPAEKTGWTVDMVPAVNRALTMGYVTWHDTKAGRSYSLTDAGYRSLNRAFR